MPRFTDPAKQSANQTASRGELSSNWRTKIDAPPRAGNNAATGSPGAPSKLNYPQQPHVWSVGMDKKENNSSGPVSGETLRGEDDPITLQAIAEGRRLYVGNMPYIASTRDVEMLFAKSEFQVYAFILVVLNIHTLINDSEHINMSVDPYSGRNPSYCFIELATKEQADRAMLSMNGKELLGRPIKVGPGVARSRTARSRQGSDQRARNTRVDPRPVFDRWIRADASEHWKGYSEQGRRLFVGGLPRMPDHHTVNADVRRLFKGYSVSVLLFRFAVSP